MLIYPRGGLRTSSESKERDYIVLHSVRSCLEDSPCPKSSQSKYQIEAKRLKQDGAWV